MIYINYTKVKFQFRTQTENIIWIPSRKILQLRQKINMNDKKLQNKGLYKSKDST